MKKALSIGLTIIISLILTCIASYIMGWYRFGDEITRTVIMRLSGFFFIIEGLGLCIYTFIITRKETPTK